MSTRWRSFARSHLRGDPRLHRRRRPHRPRSWVSSSAGRAALYALGPRRRLAGADAGGHPVSCRRPRARAGAVPSSSARTTRATSIRRCCSRRCIRSSTSSTRRSCTSFRSWEPLFDIGGFVPIDRGDRDQAMASIERGAESLQTRKFISDLSRGHAQPDRPAAAVQEGRLHHGH